MKHANNSHDIRKIRITELSSNEIFNTAHEQIYKLKLNIEYIILFFV